MSQIHKLSKELINLIAAGEVVERPASVVKELIENSIDAGSKNIIINIENYGQDLIQVKDDGSGIEKDDLNLIFEQHATSKLKTQDDLNNIITLGFRGEALASIASVSESVEVLTKTNIESHAHRAISQSEELQIKEDNRVENGTTISVNGLFKNIPARKKFLKNNNTELKHIINTFIEIAFPHLNIHFEIYHDDKLVYRLTKTTDFKNRIHEIWGNKIASNLFEISNDSETSKVHLLSGNTLIGKKKNDIQYSYLNGRFIKSKTIQAAISQAYRGFIHTDLQPTFFIFLRIDPKTVDVNIHPRKLEVKFEDEKSIFSLVYNATKKNLEKGTFQDISETVSSKVTYEINSQKDEERIRKFTINDKPRSEVYRPKPTNSFQKVQQSINFTQTLFSQIRENTMQEEISVNTTNKSSQTTLEEITNLMQIFNTYIVFERNGEMIFIDQHAAAEKISFEKLIADYGKARTKPFLVPEIYEFKNSFEKESILNNGESLRKIGLIIEDFGGNTVQILEIPEILNNFDFETTFKEVLQDEGDKLGINVSREELEDYEISEKAYLQIATVACHGSIRAGQKLSNQEMRNIIEGIKKLKNPYNCPHGRPIMWKISKYEIEKNFNRNI